MKHIQLEVREGDEEKIFRNRFSLSSWMPSKDHILQFSMKRKIHVKHVMVADALQAQLQPDVSHVVAQDQQFSDKTQ